MSKPVCPICGRDNNHRKDAIYCCEICRKKSARLRRTYKLEKALKYKDKGGLQKTIHPI